MPFENYYEDKRGAGVITGLDKARGSSMPPENYYEDMRDAVVRTDSTVNAPYRENTCESGSGNTPWAGEFGRFSLGLVTHSQI